MTFLRLLRLVAGGTLLLGLGCHSMGPREMDAPPAGNRWLADYRQAKELQVSDAATSCAFFKRLADEKDFPAREIARLRAWEICAEPASLKREELPEWLSELSLEIALKLAEKSGDKVAEMHLALEKSKQRLSQTQKLIWTDLALKRARELKQADMVRALENRLYMISPRLNPNPDEKDFLKIATDYRINRQFDKALDYYEKVIQGKRYSLEEKISAYKGIRLSRKNARSHEAHIEASHRLVRYLRRAEKLNPRSRRVRTESFDASVYLARAQWTLGRASEAEKIFLDLEKRYRGKLNLAELHWLKGRLYDERGDYEAVSREMDQALTAVKGRSELVDKILWYSAWNERRRGNHAKAAEILARLDQEAMSEFTRVRALFWLGKSYAELKRGEEEKAALEKLTELDPLGYYGLLAHRHLGLAISFKRVAVSADPEETRRVPIDLPVADWLRLIEEREALTAYLDLSAREYRKRPDQSVEGWSFLLRQYAKGGLYQKLYEAMSSLSAEHRKSVSEAHPELLFPQPWLEDVKVSALQFGVDEELIYSIMRQESAFDPRARSFADAFGLMQLLPEVAQKISEDTGVPYAQMDDLYEPRTNIALGAAHLQELLRRHRNQFILAVASYNASEKAIRGWMSTRYRGDALEFIEEIPYEETRTYVRLVMRNLIFYRLLKSKSASIEFPAWVLNLDAS